MGRTHSGISWTRNPAQCPVGVPLSPTPERPCTQNFLKLLAGMTPHPEVEAVPSEVTEHWAESRWGKRNQGWRCWGQPGPPSGHFLLGGIILKPQLGAGCPHWDASHVPSRKHMFTARINLSHRHPPCKWPGELLPRALALWQLWLRGRRWAPGQSRNGTLPDLGDRGSRGQLGS